MKCPQCGFFDTRKRGRLRDVQTYSCNGCGKKFSAQRRTKTGLQKHLWSSYVFEKQTIRELAVAHELDKRTIRAYLDAYASPKKIHHPRPIHLIVDAVYWGERTEQTSWCAVVARDYHAKENVWWAFTDRETTSIYRQCRDDLEKLGYQIISVTGDGFGGIQQAFAGIPYQMCLVHMERIVIRGTTRNPETEAGLVLLALARSIYTTRHGTFNWRLDQYFHKYRDFLNEKTIHPISGAWSYTHEELRRATHSLLAHMPDLFTFERHSQIPRTTNSLDGHFSHVRDIVEIHRGLSRAQKEKILGTIFHASTIAPKKKKLAEML